jgi:hypothetical protein
VLKFAGSIRPFGKPCATERKQAPAAAAALAQNPWLGSWLMEELMMKGPLYARRFSPPARLKRIQLTP